MKKFLVVLLSLGLIVAFGATASAVDVKFSGSYYVVGVYDNNPDLIRVQTFHRGQDTLIPVTPAAPFNATQSNVRARNEVGQLRSQASPTGNEGGQSRAFFSQRLRIQPVFQIAEGLSLTTRFDALEKQWGNTNWKGGVQETTTSRNSVGNAGALEQENIEFERAYVTFVTKFGKFDVGYMSAAAWGSTFADAETTKPRIKYTFQAGPVVLLAIYEKAFESDTSNVLLPGTNNPFVATNNLNREVVSGNGNIDPVQGDLITRNPQAAAAGQLSNGDVYRGKTDTDNDNYYLAAIYNFKQGSAGLLYGYLTGNASTLLGRTWVERERLTAVGNQETERRWANVDYQNNPFKTKIHLLEPHFKATFGPLFIEAEVDYFFGKQREFTQPLTYINQSNPNPLALTVQVPAAMQSPGGGPIPNDGTPALGISSGVRTINGVTYDDGTGYPAVGSDLYRFATYRRDQVNATATNMYGPRPGDAAGQAKWDLNRQIAQTTWDNNYLRNQVLKGNQDVTVSGLGLFLHAKLNLGPAYIGTQLAYASGDDYSDPTKSTALQTGAGADWNPALIMLNDDLAGWGGGNYGFGSLASNSVMSNNTILRRLQAEKSPWISGMQGIPNNSKNNTRWLNLYGGYNVTPKLNTELALTFAQVDKKEVLLTSAASLSGRLNAYDGWGNRINPILESGSNSLGMELDVKASYKIYDNLTYMVGAGYLWTGDYYKFGMDAITVDNNYILMNKLTLSF